MSYFAKLDNNIVTEVIRVDPALTDAEAQTFVNETFGGTWIQTSYSAAIRYNYAGVGFTYDPIADAFIASQPYPSWILDTSIYKWNAPVPYPSDGNNYEWDESVVNWVLI